MNNPFDSCDEEDALFVVSESNTGAMEVTCGKYAGRAANMQNDAPPLVPLTLSVRRDRVLSQTGTLQLLLSPLNRHQPNHYNSVYQ